MRAIDGAAARLPSTLEHTSICKVVPTFAVDGNGCEDLGRFLRVIECDCLVLLTIMVATIIVVSATDTRRAISSSCQSARTPGGLVDGRGRDDLDLSDQVRGTAAASE